MRAAAAGLVLLALALAGCVTDEPEAVDPTLAYMDDGSDAAPGQREAPEEPPEEEPAPAPVPTPVENLTGHVVEPEPFDPGPLVVIAHIDTGINPYHATFRDDSELGRRHPCEYLPGHACDVPALTLSLDAPSYEEALQRDAEVWASVEQGKLYWIPGTRIVGAISLGAGGTACPGLFDQPENLVAPGDCAEHPILDDHGHGTMTASRMAAGQHSLCTTCRIVTIEGLGGESVRWAAAQGWIDVQTNSWGSLVPATVPGATAGTRAAFLDAAQRMMTFAASGNGLAFHGVVGEPGYQQATQASGVVVVGAHDNGQVTLYHGQPPHVVADGYGGWRAVHNHMTDIGPGTMSCCTSAASPYAAGGAAGILLAARTLLGHRGTGFGEDGVGGRAAEGAPAFASGPLEDGQLTLAELHQLVRATATARPLLGPDDGLMHWFGEPGRLPEDPAEPGENPFCPGCWAWPLAYGDVPAGLPVPLYQLVGYGSVDPVSLARAVMVLRGDEPMPERGHEDTFFGVDQSVRGLVDQLTAVPVAVTPP